MANGPAIADDIAAAAARALPPEVANMARLCLADWLGVAIGAAEEPAGRIVREVAAGWRSQGRATVLFGGTAAAPFAALATAPWRTASISTTPTSRRSPIPARRSGPRPSRSAR